MLKFLVRVFLIAPLWGALLGMLSATMLAPHGGLGFFGLFYGIIIGLVMGAILYFPTKKYRVSILTLFVLVPSLLLTAASSFIAGEFPPIAISGGIVGAMAGFMALMLLGDKISTGCGSDR